MEGVSADRGSHTHQILATLCYDGGEQPGEDLDGVKNDARIQG
jgi:hypothetical protein